MGNVFVGWDIGGAHVKTAVVNIDGEVIAIYQIPCSLWKGLEQLTTAVSAILSELPDACCNHAVTMTGELVDLFDHRDQGVQQIIATMRNLLADTELLIFVGQQGLLPHEQISESQYPYIASANWLVSAAFAAQKVGNGLFIDIGSTTTDILVLKDCQVLTQAYTDYQRLISQELVYTGIVRTAVMAVAQRVVFEGHDTSIMAEHFATMADVYRLTEELNEAHDQAETADGTEKTHAASAKRLARMIGCDFCSEELSRWQQFAAVIREQQLQNIRQACQQRIAHSQLPPNAPFIGAGIGRFLARQLAKDLGHPYLDFSCLCHHNVQQAMITSADCAPAVAVAQLAHSLITS